MKDPKELLQQMQDETEMFARSTRTYQLEATIVSTLIEALKIRGEQWPESLTNEVLKCIDTLAWAFSNHLNEEYSNSSVESVEENLEQIERIIEEDD